MDRQQNNPRTSQIQWQPVILEALRRQVEVRKWALAVKESLIAELMMKK